MNRFLMLVGVAVVAAAMYVAASPASQQSSGVTAKQFKALKAQVTRLSKTVKGLKTLELTVLNDCFKIAVPINQFGDNTAAQTEGYDYSQPAGAGNFFTTALDVTDPQDTGGLFITGGDASCGTLVNGTGLRRAAAKAGVRGSGATAHRCSFTAHH